jgi:hypothetical protein
VLVAGGNGSGGEPGTTRAQRNAPRRRSIGFMPAATDLHPSLKIARASTWNTQNKTTRHGPHTHVPSLPPAPHRRSRGTITSNIVRLGRHLGCTHTHKHASAHVSQASRAAHGNCTGAGGVTTRRTCRTSCAPMFWKRSLKSIALATVTPIEVQIVWCQRRRRQAAPHAPAAHARGHEAQEETS